VPKGRQKFTISYVQVVYRLKPMVRLSLYDNGIVCLSVCCLSLAILLDRPETNFDVQ